MYPTKVDVDEQYFLDIKEVGERKGLNYLIINLLRDNVIFEIVKIEVVEAVEEDQIK